MTERRTKTYEEGVSDVILEGRIKSAENRLESHGDSCRSFQTFVGSRKSYLCD